MFFIKHLLNVEMDNDLLEYLRKTFMSGMGIPASMLNYADELEFARSVSMQNGIFLRSVIVKQKKLTPPFSSLYQDLYENEYGNSTVALFDKKELDRKNKLEREENEKTNSKKVSKVSKKDNNEDIEKIVDINAIKVKFPSPSSLNAANLADQIGTANNIVQAIVEGTFDANDTNTDQQHKFKFTKELNKIYMPNVDWEKIEDIYEKTKTESVEDKITGILKNAGNNSGESSEY